MTTSADDHPECSAEQAQLRATLARLEQRIDELGRMEAQGFTTNDTAALHARLVAIYQNLVTARERVYFGRLDVAPDGSAEPETHYIGRIGFDHAGQIVVVDWRAPLARLFSRRRPGPVEYDSPDGQTTAQLHLKRHLEIEHGRLLGIYDEYDTRPSTPAPEAGARLVDPDAYLRAILSGRGEARMQDIVATIQEHQDELIRAEARQVLVIQGVAGSGKTSIALHRVAFLLYPEHRLGIEARRCIVFGPNQLFLGYVASVLPGLGVQDIPQTTLDAWALERLGLTDARVVDSTLEALLAGNGSAREKQARVRRSQVKASLRMGRVLERLSEWWRLRLAPPAQGLAFGDLGPLQVTAQLPRIRLLEIHGSLAELPVARHRQRFQELVLGELMGAYASALERRLQELEEEGEQLRERRGRLLAEAARLDEYAAFATQTGDLDLETEQAASALGQGAQGLRALAEYFGRRGELTVLRAARLKEETRQEAQRAAVRAAVQARLEAELETIWPSLDPVAAYRELLSNRELLGRLGRGVLSGEEIALLQSAPPVDAAVDVSDLPALCYLHTLAHGVAVPVYDHVVVDEAQDVAPLYLAVLRRLSRNGSFTVLGDLAQGVYSYRGLASWDEAREAFAGLPYRYGEVRESYRSTLEIIAFANRILELLAPQEQAPLLARPFERHGPPVHIRRLERPEQLAPELAAAINDLRREGYENIAVIARTAAACAVLAEGLEAAGLHEVQVAVTAEQAYAGGVLVLPVHLSKGMEFEAVLLARADEATYGTSEFDGRLLYVAATRALHVLQILAVGAPNTFVELAASG